MAPRRGWEERSRSEKALVSSHRSISLCAAGINGEKKKKKTWRVQAGITFQATSGEVQTQAAA